MIKWLLIFLFISIHTLSSLAQSANLQGQVVDEQNQPLVGVLIRIDSSLFAQVTDEKGNFFFPHLKTNYYYTVQCSYVGFATQTIDSILLSVNNTKNILVKLKTPLTKEIIVYSEKEKEQNEMVTQQFFEQNTKGTFAKSLEQKAGVNCINVGVGIAKPVIRGLSANRVVVNNNGVKQEGQQWGSDHGLEVDQFGVDRVEIVKGAASLQYGSDALGGAINILPNTVPQKNSLQASILGIYKSNNQHGGLSAYLATNINDFFVDFRFSYQDFADYRVPTDSFVYNDYVLPIINNQLKNTAGKERNIKATIGLNKRWGISRLTFSQYHLQAGIFSGAVGIPRAYALTDDGNDRDLNFPRQKVSHISLVSNTDLNIGKKDRLEINIGYQNNNRQEFSYPHAHNNQNVNSSDVALQLILQTISAGFIYHHKPNSKWQNKYGVNIQYQNNKRDGFEFLLPNFSTIQTGLYSINNYVASQKLDIQFGLRFDYANNNTSAFAQEIYDDNQNVVALPKAEATNQHFFNYSAALGLQYECIKDSWWFSSSFNKSYRVPYPSETVSDGIHHGSFRHEKGTKDLKAEQGYQLEIATNFVHKKFKVNAALYGNYFQDFIYLSPTAKFSTLPEGGQVYQYQQTNAIYAGGELTWDWEIVKNLELHQAFDYVWNINLKNRLGLPFTPPTGLLSKAKYTIPTVAFFRNIYLQASHRYSFAQKRVDRNEPATPAYHLVNLGFGFDIQIKKQKIQFGLQVQNLLNTSYLQHLSRYRVLDIPEQGRNFVVTMKIPLTVNLK